MRKKWRLWAACLGICGVIFFGVCQKQTQKQETVSDEPIEIPVVFLINPATNLSSNQEFVEDFNKKYEGKYHIDVEWLTESAGGYREKLKQWNVLNEMPAIITDAGFDYDFYQMLVENERLVDLRSYMEKSPHWMEAMRPEILEDCQDEQGRIFLSPLGSDVQSYAGIIYNQELLAEAGYETFPKTWKEFWQCLEDLQNMGITPLSLHGSGSYWVPMLLATSYMENTVEGQAFLEQDFPESYQNASMEEMMKILKKMYQYTFEDAVEVDYDKAATRFCNGEAAIFANGYWMVEEMPPHVAEKMRFAPFPGNILMNSPRMSAWAVVAGYNDEITEGAVKILEYRIQCSVKNTEKLLNQENLDELKTSYVETVKGVKRVMPNYQIKWEQEIQNDFFTKYIPQFLGGEMDIPQFLQAMDERLKIIRESK